jgi:hypothetical protein
MEKLVKNGKNMSVKNNRNKVSYIENLKFIEMYVSLINKIVSCNSLNKNQKKELSIGYNIYLEGLLGGSWLDDEWYFENIEKMEYLYFMTLIGNELSELDFESWVEEEILWKLFTNSIS